MQYDILECARYAIFCRYTNGLEVCHFSDAAFTKKEAKAKMRFHYADKHTSKIPLGKDSE